TFLVSLARESGADAEELLGAMKTYRLVIEESGRKIAQAGDNVWRLASVPDTASLAKVAAASKSCTACPLYKNATQTVFGEGPKHATMMLLGEQPGDYEDVAGKPFVGPAGKILNRALQES